MAHEYRERWFVFSTPPGHLPGSCDRRYFLWFQSLKNTPELSTELTNEPKPNNANSERNTMVTLFIITVVVLRYAVTVYKSQVFEKIPFGDVLIEIFEYDESEHSKQLIPG